MNIKRAAQILEQEGIQTDTTDKSIYGIPKIQDENIYGLEKRGNQWIYVFVEYERNGVGRETVLQSFSNEPEAVNYYFLVTLQSHYFWKYILPAREQNSTYGIGDTIFTFDNLKNTLNSINIEKPNYSFFEEETIPHSVHLQRVNPEECKVQFIGSKNQVVFETIELENWDAFSTMFDYVYFTALLDQKSKSLVECNELAEPFSDEDYEIFLTE